MKQLILIIYLFITILSAGETQNIPLSMKSFSKENRDIEYTRGTYLIILAKGQLVDRLTNPNNFPPYGDNFVEFKETQGYTVEVISIDVEGLTTAVQIKDKIQQDYGSSLEYILLVGDVSGNYVIPTFHVESINETGDFDVTDYPYTYHDSDEILSPYCFIGRWSIQNQNDLVNIKTRTIEYSNMTNLTPEEKQYLNRSLLVAGNYKTNDGLEVPPETWPVTPVWTSLWLQEEQYYYGYQQVDTVFYHAGNWENGTEGLTTFLKNTWSNGVGVINYRGWGDANGWHKPWFHRDDINDLLNGWKLPVVFSFVCNTGDFGNNSHDYCFGEALITYGGSSSPKGAVAMIGPSDLDTDTRFNNVMCGAMWDALLEERVFELAPALHTGKQALIKEFGDLVLNEINVVEFYHEVYGTLGDPSLSIWLQAPETMTADIENNLILSNSFVTTTVTDENLKPLADVVGALLYNGNLIAKGLSNHEGVLNIDFENVPVGASLDLYLNKAQFMQKHISLTFSGDDGAELNDYYVHEIERDSEYNFYDSESGHELAPVYNWIEINVIGTNLDLVDDSHAKDVSIGFGFQFYGTSYNSLTVGSNGWASFLPCLDGNGDGECRVINHFSNNSIGFPIGPYGLLAPFYDDLDDNGGTLPFDVYFWTNSIDTLIVQWDNVSNGQDDEFCPDCVKETFQLILDGGDISESGDGAIIFQYKEIHDIDDHGCTIGIEEPDKDEGVEYLFNYQLADGASGLANGLAIKFTTEGNGMGVNPSSTPQNFTLMQNYPNPFNPSTTIQYHLNQKSTVNISVYNLSGQEIRQLADSNLDPGQHSVSWDGKDEKGVAVGSGMYFYRLNVHSSFAGTRDGLSKTGKMVLLR